MTFIIPCRHWSCSVMVIGASPGATDMAVDVGEEGAVVDLRIWTFLISGKDHLCSILLKADMNQCRCVADIGRNFEPLSLTKIKAMEGEGDCSSG